MPTQFPPEPDRDIIPQRVAERLLARASVLDATQAAGSTVTALRAAALEAGISEGAFDAALAELRGAEQTGAPEVRERPRRPLRMWAMAAMVVALVAVSRLAFPVGAPPTPIAATMVEEPLLLQCLSPAEATELIRPLLPLPDNTIVASRDSRVLTIRGTPEQIGDVLSTLDRYETGGSPACARAVEPR